MKHVQVTNAIKVEASNPNADLLIIGMGSTGGTIDEARKRLSAEGIESDHITVRLMHPFPADQLKPHLDKARKVIVVENNATGQLADLIKLNVGGADKIHSLLKYNGNPFLPADIYNQSKEMLTWQR